MSLVPFVGVLVDEGREVKVVGDFPEGGDSGRVTDGSRNGLGGLLEACEEVVGFAEMSEDDGTRFAVDAAGLDELPIGMSVDGFFLEAGHGVSVYVSCADGQVQLAG